MIKKIVFLVLILFSTMGLCFFTKESNYINKFNNLNIEEACFIFNDDKIDLNKNKWATEKCLYVGNKVLTYIKNRNLDFWFKQDYEYFEAVLYNTKLDDLLKTFNLKILLSEQIRGKTAYYCYSCNLNKQIYIDNKRINLQIVKDEFGIKIGYPMIYTCY